MTNSVSLDRVEIQTRPLGHPAENSYCVWLRYEGEIAGRAVVDVQGPLTPEQAAAAGFPLDIVLGGVAAAAIRQAEAAGAALAAVEARLDIITDEMAGLRARYSAGEEAGHHG